MILIMESIFQTISLPLELIIIGSLLISDIDFEKRSRIQKYILLIPLALFFLIAGRLIGNAEEIDAKILAITFIYCLACYVTSLGYIYYSKKMSFLTALYIANVTYLIQHLTHSFCLIFLRLTGISYENTVEISIFLLMFITVYFFAKKKLMLDVEKAIYSPKETSTTVLVLGVAIFLSAVAKQKIMA